MVEAIYGCGCPCVKHNLALMRGCLMAAAGPGHEAVLALVLGAAADAAVPPTSLEPALHDVVVGAAARGDLPALEVLLGGRAPARGPGRSHGAEAMKAALMQRRAPVLDWLVAAVDRGTVPAPSTADGVVMLIAAAGCGHLPTVWMLLRQGVATQEVGASTARELAGCGWLRAVAQALRRHGQPKPHWKYGNYGIKVWGACDVALVAAAGGGHARVVEALLEGPRRRGPESRARRGATAHDLKALRMALAGACEVGAVEVVDLLLAAGAGRSEAGCDVDEVCYREVADAVREAERCGYSVAAQRVRDTGMLSS